MTDIEFAELFEKASIEAIRLHPNDFEARVQMAKTIYAAGVRAALANLKQRATREHDRLDGSVGYAAEDIERELLGPQDAPAGAQSGGS